LRTGPRSSVSGRWLIALLAILTVVACDNDSSTPEDRRFATDPTEEGVVATEAPTETPAPPTAEAAKPTASPAAILKSRGAPDTIYSLRDDTITAVTVVDGQTGITAWDAPEDQGFAAIDDAPDGSQLAALVTTADNTANLVIYDSAGSAVATVENILDLSGLSATPVSDGTGGALQAEMQLSISWSPLGDQILVSASDGQLRSVAASGGEPVSYEPDASLNGLESAKWSPEGNVIGALVRDASGIGKVYSLAVDGAKLKVSELVSAESIPNANSIELFAWSVDGSSIFYVAANRQGNEAVGGQLFNRSLGDDSATLVTTSGRGGPSGSIQSFVPSPDGRSVAVVIAVRDGRTWTFHSLLVKSLRSETTYDVPVSGVNEVPGVWWVSDGLVWNIAADPEDIFVLSKPDGSETELIPGDAQGTPKDDATPEASPAANG
jgi:WD40 repeat protein